jgi:hypothetical protein
VGGNKNSNLVSFSGRILPNPGKEVKKKKRSVRRERGEVEGRETSK